MVHTGTVYQTTKKLKLFDAPFGGNILRFLTLGSFVIGTDRRRLQRRVRVLYPQPGYVNIALGYLHPSRRSISSLLKHTRTGRVVFNGAPEEQPEPEIPPARVPNVLPQAPPAPTPATPSGRTRSAQAPPRPRQKPSKPPSKAKPKEHGAPKPKKQLKQVHAIYGLPKPRLSYEATRGILEMFLFNATRDVVHDVAWEAYGESCLVLATRELVVETASDTYGEELAEAEELERCLRQQIAEELAPGGERDRVEQAAKERDKERLRKRKMAREALRAKKVAKTPAVVKTKARRARSSPPKSLSRARSPRSRRCSAAKPPAYKKATNPAAALPSRLPAPATRRAMAPVAPSPKRRRFNKGTPVRVTSGGWEGHSGTLAYTCPDGRVAVELDDCYGLCKLPPSAIMVVEVPKANDYTRWLHL